MDPLTTTTIGTTEVTVTSLGLGTAPLGGWPQAVSEEDGHGTISTAWDMGLRYFDTAPFYGYGQSERWVGDVLAGRPRSEFTLSTKVGRLLEPHDEKPVFFHGNHTETAVSDFSYEGAKRSLEESLERLRLDRADIVLIHDPDDHLDEALDGAYMALAELRSQGVVGAIGAGMNWSEPLAYLAERADFDCVLLAGRYTLFEQHSMEALLPLAEEKGFSVIAGGVFNGGLLVDPGPDSTYNYAPAEPSIIERAQRLKAVCDEHGVPLRAAALQFPLAHPAVVTVATGARTPAEIDENVSLIQVAIPPELWDDLRAQGLLHADAPVPELSNPPNTD